jgi:hypothetical protein
MRYALFLSLAFWLFLPARAADAPPETTMHAFYAWVLDHPSLGVPNAEDRAQLAPLLSMQLVKLLEQAAETDARCLQTVLDGDKPNVYEGDLFVGIYEGATDAAFHHVIKKGSVATVDIDLIYIDPRFPKADANRASVWRNTLELRKVGERWVVQNVKFGSKTSLLSVLRDHIAEGARSCVITGSAAAY